MFSSIILFPNADGTSIYRISISLCVIPEFNDLITELICSLSFKLSILSSILEFASINVLF